jgi:glycosyltransferase involved in cell wall biosynthesis
MCPNTKRLEGGLRTHDKSNKELKECFPLVSIVTVVFNGKKTLEQTIQSVLKQTYNNIEYIIIDGRSTDGTIEILKKHEDNIDYWVSEPDKGIGHAFNKGITASSGDIIGLINADDWYTEDAVETIVNHYIKNSDCVYHAKLQYWDSNMHPSYTFSANDEKILIRGTINHPTVFVPRKIYEEVGLFDISFKNAVDYEWLIRAKFQGVKFCYLDTVISNMRSEGTSDKKWFNNYVEMLRARNLHGMSFLRNIFYFLEMVIITACRKMFERIGLYRIVRLYRKHFSIIKKM